MLLSCCTVCHWGPYRCFRGENAVPVWKSEGNKVRNSLRYVSRLPLGLTVMGARFEALSGPMGAMKSKRDKNKGVWNPKIF
jgi:hypothetical protein